MEPDRVTFDGLPFAARPRVGSETPPICGQYANTVNMSSGPEDKPHVP